MKKFFNFLKDIFYDIYSLIFMAIIFIIVITVITISFQDVLKIGIKQKNNRISGNKKMNITEVAKGGKELPFVSVTIPIDATDENIADILLEMDLIKDKKDFLKKSSKKLKKNSGTFKIQIGSNYDKIIDVLNGKSE